ncbi:hypothetical protein [Actinoalloteichus caeruleus]|uniref:hypothetical protein n=1 Tax=Actinoalloteichus cyanogriseus TaxID=2893586 RepID=UPI003BB85529
MNTDLSPLDEDRFRWYHRVTGWDVERRSTSTCQVELDHSRTRVVLRLGSTRAGSIGLARDEARRLATALRTGTATRLPVAHEMSPRCSLVVTPEEGISGTMWRLLPASAGVADWTTRFDIDAAQRIATLLTEGVALLRLSTPHAHSAVSTAPPDLDRPRP